MNRCFLVATVCVLLSAGAALADGSGTSKLKEWPYGPYDKLHRDEGVIVSNLSSTIIIVSNQSWTIIPTTTTNHTEILIYSGTQESAVSRTATNKIVAPKLELRPK